MAENYVPMFLAGYIKSINQRQIMMKMVFYNINVVSFAEIEDGVVSNTVLRSASLPCPPACQLEVLCLEVSK